MGKASRDKGKRGEREVVELFRSAGCSSAARTAPLQAGGVEGEADVRIGPGFFVEVKRVETPRIMAWLQQAECACADGDEVILAYRRSREPWHAVVRQALVDDLQAELKTIIPEQESPFVGRLGNLGGRYVQVSLYELALLLVEAGWIE